MMKELENANIELVQIIEDRPHCKLHGAMNKVGIKGVWRCICTYDRETDNACRAGCVIEE